MAKRRVNTFDLGEELHLKLQKASLKTVEDVLSHSCLHLMIQLRLSATETRDLVQNLSLACLPPFCKAYDLLEAELHNAIALGDEGLDRILHGGVKRGALTEFTGPPGVGKTQMCFHLALRCLHSGSSRNGVCCIDTEGAFRTERMVEVLLNYEKRARGAAEEEEEALLSKLHIFQPKTVESFSQILSSLELFCLEHDVGLVLVDSVASLARKEFPGGAVLRRAALMASWAAQVKALAHQLDVAVVVTNQVSSRLRGEEGEEESVVDGEGRREQAKGSWKRGAHVVGSALGGTWTHFVNTRFILQFVEADLRQLIIAKSPVAPIAVKNYRIASSGIQFEGELNYTFTGMNPNLHRMKVQPALL